VSLSFDAAPADGSVLWVTAGSKTVHQFTVNAKAANGAPEVVDFNWIAIPNN
jgi:hypothetical protein